MQIRMDKENRELKAHGSYEFPVNISYRTIMINANAIYHLL